MDTPCGKPQPSSLEIEKMEEMKLKSKLGSMPMRPMGRGGHSAFLQKRLQRGQKYFDSGDYNMAKHKELSLICICSRSPEGPTVLSRLLLQSPTWWTPALPPQPRSAPLLNLCQRKRAPPRSPNLK